MIKKLATITTLFFFFVTPSVVNAQFRDSEHISNFFAQYIINEDGTVDVTERISYYFDTQRHGIFRTIPLTKQNEEGKTFLIEVFNVNVTNEKGEAYKYQNNSSKKELSLKIGDPNRTITGEHTYIINYSISGALTYFEDHDEFYWNVTGTNWNVPIESVSADIYHPQSTNNIEAYCYTGEFGSSEQNCRIDDSENLVEISTTQSLSAGEGLTVVSTFPKDIVDVVKAKRDTLGLFEILKYVAIGLSVLALYFVLPIYLLIKNIKKRKKYRELENRQVAAWFEPPKSNLRRSLTAGEVGILYDRKGDIRDITASIIQLAQKGHLKIVEKQEKKLFKDAIYEFVKLKDWESDKTLQKFEKSILEFLFDGEETVTTKEISKRKSNQSKITDIYKEISNTLVAEGIFNENPTKTKNKWLGILFVGAFFFNPLMVIASIFGMKSAERTEHGAKAYATVKSLENFVKSQEKQIEFQAKNQMLFEKLLPYATALGVEEIWVERFDDIDMQEPDWAESKSGAFVTGAALSNFNNSFNSSVAMSTSRSSSGFSSGAGGGFSGGGGGGGGGGSW